MKKVLIALNMAEYLSQKYDVVIGNPPYMGGNAMPGHLKQFADRHYDDTSSNLYSMFIERSLTLAKHGGLVGLITLQGWLFAPTLEALRRRVLEKYRIASLLHLGPRAFPEISGEVVQTAAFTIDVAGSTASANPVFFRLIEGESEAKRRAFLSGQKQFTTLTPSDMQKCPNAIMAYWLPKNLTALFDGPHLDRRAVSGGRCKTHGDDIYVRYFWEVAFSEVDKPKRWRLFEKGGGRRSYFGNRQYVVDWRDEAREHYDAHGGLSNPKYWQREGLCWSDITSGRGFFRLKPADSEYGSKSPTIFFGEHGCDLSIVAYLNSSIAHQLIAALNPSFHINVGDVLRLPELSLDDATESQLMERVAQAIEIARGDWEAYETGYGFSASPLTGTGHPIIEKAYLEVRGKWQHATSVLHQLEVNNNAALITHSNLALELSAEVPLSDVTLTCNPHYRYGNDRSDNELEEILLADTMREFISYAVGCMFGRYCLDKPGLILADQGETLQDYLKQVPKPTFTPDEDNALPVLDDEYFVDDVVGRFKTFLRITFGDEHYDENLGFIENALGKSIRKYFLNDFYAHHLQMYKKRPIYWLFSSPKKSFNVLIYMHRYRPDTVSRILNDYLREFVEKLKARRANQEEISISESARASDKSKATKEMGRIDKILAELDDYERNILFPLAAKKIEIDLDDGVMVNYNKFGDALRNVPGLSGQ